MVPPFAFFHRRCPFSAEDVKTADEPLKEIGIASIEREAVVNDDVDVAGIELGQIDHDLVKTIPVELTIWHGQTEDHCPKQVAIGGASREALRRPGF